ncbi:hypothetical protein BGZ76_007594 [Entomortierella beljakovae]|nr:hypothetical protein BGZ76_007594 [Entomortierella beljakovae]
MSEYPQEKSNSPSMSTVDSTVISMPTSASENLLSPSTTLESRRFGEPSDELQKLSIGEERYARAVQNTAPVGSFSGTVPLPLMSQPQTATQRRRPSGVFIEPFPSSGAGMSIKSDQSNGTFGSSSHLIDPETGMTFASLTRTISRRNDSDRQDLESNMKRSQEMTEKLKQQEVSFNEKVMYMQDDESLPDVVNMDSIEWEKRRKSKGGVLSQLLKIHRNEAAASSIEKQTSSSTSARNQSVKKSRKGLYYRSSRNNSTTSLRNNSPSVSTTPKVSPRNSVALENRDSIYSVVKKKKKISDNRSIHGDIADILACQSFLIMIARSLILYGAPSHRIEETCSLLATKLQVDASFSLLPGLMTISFNDPETHTSDTRHLRCSQGMDMNKLECVHEIVQAVLRGASVEVANQELESLSAQPGLYPLWLTLLGWAGSSAFVAPLAFNGGGSDMAVAGFCGLLVGTLGIVAGKFPIYGNVFEMTASILVGFIAKALNSHVCFSAVALASVVVLLPGLMLTQAIMELSSRNIVSGSVKMFYALMYAFFLAFGLTLGSELFDFVSGSTAISATCSPSISHWWYFIIFPAVSMSINIVFNAHPRQWFGMTTVTAVGFVVTIFLKSRPQISGAIAAFAVGVCGQLYGRLTGRLSYVPLLSGILILVPGSVGVRGILEIIGSDPTQGFSFVLTMIHVSVAITLGVFCSALVWYPFWRKNTFMNF